MGEPFWIGSVTGGPWRYTTTSTGRPVGRWGRARYPCVTYAAHPDTHLRLIIVRRLWGPTRLVAGAPPHEFCGTGEGRVPIKSSSTPNGVSDAAINHHHRHARTAIVDAAATMMYHRGVAATSIGDVFHASGAEGRELHRHFRDKTELVRAVIDRELTAVLDGHDAAHAIDSWDGLERWVSRVVDAQPADGGPFACPLGALATELTSSQEYRPTVDAAFRTWERRLAAGLRRIQERGELDSDADPDRLAASLLAAMQGGYLLASVHGRIEILRDVLDDAVAALRRYQV